MNEVEELFGEFRPKHLDWLSLYKPQKNMQNQSGEHFHIGQWDFENKEKIVDKESIEYRRLKYLWDNKIVPPVYSLNFDEYKNHKKIVHFSNGDTGLADNAHYYNSVVHKCYTFERERKDGEHINEETIDIQTGESIPLSNDENFERQLQSVYYHSAKAHWLIDDIRINGLHNPIQGALHMQEDHTTYSIQFHPGSIRSKVFNAMRWPTAKYIVWDAYNYIKSEPLTLDEWIDEFMQCIGINGLVFSYNGGVIECHVTQPSYNHRKLIGEFNKKASKQRANKPLTIYVGYDSRHSDIAEISKFAIEDSIKNINSNYTDFFKDKEEPIIKFLDKSKIKEYTREDKNQSTEFTYTRFLIPYLENYEGISMFLDDDIIFRKSPLELSYFLSPKNAVACLQYEYDDFPEKKFDGQNNVTYPKKLWSSFMVFNNNHPDCKKLTPEIVNTETGKYLHQFEWTQNIDMIPEQYIFTEGLDDIHHKYDFYAVHYTHGGPWINGMDITDISMLEYYEKIEEKYNSFLRDK